MVADGSGLFDNLERWAAEARAREAAEARVRERWLRTQAEEDARLANVLAALAERRADVVVAVTPGARPVSGRLTAVGRDFVAMQTAGGQITLIALRALAWVRPTGVERRRRREVAVGQDGDGMAEDGETLAPEASGPALADVLALAAADRPRVALLVDGVALTGRLRAVGVDVLMVEITGETGGLAYVPLAVLDQVSLLDSG